MKISNLVFRFILVYFILTSISWAERMTDMDPLAEILKSDFSQNLDLKNQHVKLEKEIIKLQKEAKNICLKKKVKSQKLDSNIFAAAAIDTYIDASRCKVQELAVMAKVMTSDNSLIECDEFKKIISSLHRKDPRIDLICLNIYRSRINEQVTIFEKYVKQYLAKNSEI